MRKFSLILFFAATILFAAAQNVPNPMVPARLVNDFAGIFETEGARILEDSLEEFNRTTSTQIAVVTVNDLDGYPASDYALAVLRKWGVGQSGKDNGIVMLIKPRNENGSGNVFIAVGTGLEGVLNDAKAGRIIDRYMMEYLIEGDYTSAASAGATALRNVVRGEFNADELDEDIDVFDIITIVIIIIVLLVIIFARDNNGSGFGGGRSFRPIIFPMGRGGGGFSSGGFGGFGGGSGIGGGAGRSF